MGATNPSLRLRPQATAKSIRVTSSFSQRGSRGLEFGKANTPQQVLETWVVPQAVHARIYTKIDKPVGVLFVRFLQVFNRAVVFSQADMDSGEEIRCDILCLR